MKITKLISIMAILLGFGVAHAETKVGGEIFANYTMKTSDSDDTAKEGSFGVTRARVSLENSFSDSWSAKVTAETTAATSLKYAYLKGMGVLTSNDTFMFGRQASAYKSVVEPRTQRWIDATTGESFAGAADIDGITYGMKFNDMITGVASINNNTNGAAANTTRGFGLLVDIKAMDNLAVTVAYDTAGKGKLGTTADSGADDVDGYKNLLAAVSYMSDMFDATLEYANHDADLNAADTKATTAMSLEGSYKYADGKAVFLKYTSLDTEYQDQNTGEASRLTIGPTFVVTKGINTGVFYEMVGHKNSTTNPAAEDSNYSQISWKWAANF